MADISRNAACPCGSGLKFKRCCLDKVDWEQIIKKGQDPRPYLSVRGRNLAFINKMADLFLFDALYNRDEKLTDGIKRICGWKNVYKEISKIARK